MMMDSSLNKLSILVASFFAILYITSIFGITYPDGSIFLLIVIAIPLFSSCAIKARNVGTNRVWLELTNSSDMKYFILLVVLFFGNFFFGVVATEVTKEVDGEYFLRMRDMSFKNISIEEYKSYLRADFRLFLGHLLGFVCIGTLFERQADRILSSSKLGT